MQAHNISLLIISVLVWALLSVTLSCVPCGGRRQYDDSDIFKQANHVADSSATPQSAKAGPKKEGGGRPRKRCCPYDFDSSKCKIVDDRLLCGFNKNAGFPESRDTFLELKDGCRLRNGRLECGYVHPPFTNPRRPPPRPIEGGDAADPGDDEVIPPDDDDDTPGDSSYKGLKDKIKLVLNNTNNQMKTTISKKQKNAMANCVEVGGRIVCKEW